MPITPQFLKADYLPPEHLISMGVLDFEAHPDSIDLASFGLTQYTYVKTLWSGISSPIILVRDSTTSDLLVCKHVSIADANRFRLWQSLDHPKLVKIHEIVESGGRAFLVMDYCDGGSLADGGGLDERAATRVFADIVDALSYLHARGLPHGSVWLEHILLDRRGGARLAPGGGKTPIAYQSPEALLGRPCDGEAADIWALGVALFSACAGAFPWTAGDEFDEITGPCNIQMPPTFSRQLALLIGGMLEKHIARRYTINLVATSPWITRDARNRSALPALRASPGRTIAPAPKVIRIPSARRAFLPHVQVKYPC
jgi:serine/threonine protein kinase